MCESENPNRRFQEATFQKPTPLIYQGEVPGRLPKGQLLSQPAAEAALTALEPQDDQNKLWMVHPDQAQSGTYPPPPEGPCVERVFSWPQIAKSGGQMIHPPGSLCTKLHTIPQSPELLGLMRGQSRCSHPSQSRPNCLPSTLSHQMLLPENSSTLEGGGGGVLGSQGGGLRQGKEMGRRQEGWHPGPQAGHQRHTRTKHSLCLPGGQKQMLNQ